MFIIAKFDILFSYCFGFGLALNVPSSQQLWSCRDGHFQGFSLASAIGHSPKIVPDVREFAVQFGQFVRDDFRKRTLYGYAQ